MQDTYRHRGLRKQMVDEITKKGIKNNRVLAAMMAVPRHFFFDKIFDTHAYEDKAFPIAAGQTISQPYTVAFQTELLNVQPGDKILEVGTGSGYQSCILLELGAELITIEYQELLYKKVVQFLPKINYSARVFHGDGSKGMSSLAPYDGIVVTAGAPSVPEILINQLKPAGKLVIPVGDHHYQIMKLITKINNGQITEKDFNRFRFVPLRGKNGWNKQ